MVIDPKFQNWRKTNFSRRPAGDGFDGCWSILRLHSRAATCCSPGSPIPLWYIERLDRQVPVKEVTEKSLVLADGRSVPLPFIKRLPVNDPVFVQALKRGVELGEDGELIGLLTVYPNCGNDPFRWYTNGST